MAKNNKKRVSSYNKLKKEYPYSFYDGVLNGDKYLGFGLKEPKLAENYALRLLEVVEELLEDNYTIVDCKASFSDDDYGSYGEMKLIINGERTRNDIERWNNYYLHGPGKVKRDVWKDLICRCTLHMNLEHKDGKPRLSVDSYHVTNETDKRKKLKNKFKLKHHLIGGFDFKTGKYIKYNPNAWIK